jgi:FkbM family methyltransferase
LIGGKKNQFIIRNKAELMKRWIRSSAILLIKLLPQWAYPVLRGPLRGAKFILGTLAGEARGASVYLNMVEPEQTTAFVNTIKNGQVFFDIGANVGYYTILGARLVGTQGRVFAFEPVIRNVVYLYQHILLNKANNVIIVPTACSDFLSLQIFTAGENFATGHLGEDGDAHNTFPVPTISVDEVIQQMNVLPDVIKIDVEGAELSVLKGAQNTLRVAKPKILLSTHSEILRKTCLEYLGEFGYTFEVLSQDKTNPSEFLASFVGY